jgi:hypothetical protein
MFEASNYEAMLAHKMILVGYKAELLDAMQGMIKSALSILDISGALPTLPSITNYK